MSLINPVALSIGAIQIHWYGLMYLFAFLAGWLLAHLRVKQQAWRQAGWNTTQVDDLVTWVMLGVVLGGRVGYVLFYDFPAFLADPVELFRIWNGGMSFHGGLLGVLVSIWWWARRNKHSFLNVVDFTAPLVPTGLLFGRIGNFINGELWGAPTSLPWGVVFPTAGSVPRHPSQLYEALFEGVILFVILWIYAAKPREEGRVSGVFAILYAVFRFSVEFVREPDAHIGYLAFGWLTMGQVLCLPLVAVGLWLWVRQVPSARRG